MLVSKRKQPCAGIIRNWNHYLTVTSVLGLMWDNCTDTLSFTQLMHTNELVVTKRTLLGKTASMFDPLGLLSPVVMPAVEFISRLWEKSYGWDEPLKDPDREEWNEIARTLEEASTVSIPQYHKFNKAKEVCLHVFTDASNKAGAANA
jgi:hypothetical protein